ncbi:hypothetical protein SYNTR_0670 [Candidatus Syntrophocurvum alkaliphilum]|uniref:Uncharacterized protein n=1 Tax=Candidatus Syntrophocurvum alkaliphilum TaxID=2293317 RepID=A0A6I6D8P7_9FIRM|nr:hypothetical protein [Candidatus Syntrophocurvum alkaliphilum]QGT99263.1 hypothetical protein SYNTR_0670 [Candidatus Syntrophocurvum alkaliphilum]
MIYGLIALSIGLILLLYFLFVYKSTNKKLLPTKNDDLVTYYIDFAIKLYPVPFWSGVIGLLLVLGSSIFLIINFIIS